MLNPTVSPSFTLLLISVIDFAFTPLALKLSIQSLPISSFDSISILNKESSLGRSGGRRLKMPPLIFFLLIFFIFYFWTDSDQGI